MRLDLEPERGLFTATLSRRNLVSFLHFLASGEPAVIVCGDVYLNGEPVYGLLLRVIAQADAEHYARRAQPPGQMPGETEAFLESLEREPGLLEPLVKDGSAPAERAQTGEGTALDGPGTVADEERAR